MSNFTKEREELLDDLKSLSEESGPVKEADVDTNEDLDDVDTLCSELEDLQKKAQAGDIQMDNSGNIPSGEEAKDDGEMDGMATGEEAANQGERSGMPSGEEAVKGDNAHDSPEMQGGSGGGVDGAPTGGEGNVEGMPNSEAPQDQENNGQKTAMKKCPKCGEEVEADEDGKCPHCGTDLKKTAGKEDLPPELREQAEEKEEESENDEEEDSDEEEGEEEDSDDEDDKEAKLGKEAQGLETDIIENNLEAMLQEGFSDEAVDQFSEKVASFRETEEPEVPSLTEGRSSTTEDNGFLERI